LTNQQLLDTVCRTNLRDYLRDLWIPVAAVTTNNEEGAIGAFGDGEDDGGDEVLGVVLLLENLDLLAKTRAVSKRQ